MEDKIRAERRLPPLNFTTHLSSQELVDQLNHPHKDTKKDLVKFKTKEEEADYMDETNRLIFKELKAKLVDAVMKSCDDVNYLRFKRNLEISQDVFCVDTMDKLKRKILVTNESIENKRVLLYVTLYLKGNIVEMNGMYSDKWTFMDERVVFNNLLDDKQVGIVLVGRREPSQNEVHANNADNNMEKVDSESIVNASFIGQNLKQVPAVQKRTSTVIFQNESLAELVNTDLTKPLASAPRENIFADINISHIDSKSLQTLISTLYTVTNKLPKYTILLVTLKQSNNVPVVCDLAFLAEHLQNEVEAQIHIENGPVIDDFRNKLENEEFEDNSIIFMKNHASFESYSTFVYDHFNIRRCKLWKSQATELGILQSYADTYIEDDASNNIWDYKPRTQVLDIRKLIGPEIGKGLEFIQKTGPNFKAYRNREQWPLQLLILGGEFSFDKLEFLVNYSDFFDLIILVGRFGVLISLPESQLDQMRVAKEVNSAIQYSKNKIKDNFYKIKVPIAYTSVPETEALKAFGEKEPYSEDYVQALVELYSESSEEVRILTDVSDNLASLEDLSDITDGITAGMLDISPGAVEEIVSLFDQHEKVWLVDSLSLNPIDCYGLANEKFVEVLQRRFGIFDIDPSNAVVKAKLSVVGVNMLSQINQFNYYKKKKSAARIEARKEKEAKQKKGVKFDSDNEEEEQSENSDELESNNESGSARSDNEDIIENSALVSNNTFKDTTYILRLLNGRQSDGELISNREVR